MVFIYVFDILDISDPSNIQFMGRYFYDNLWLLNGELVVQGSYVYLPTSWGIDIVDVSDPTNPELVWTVTSLCESFNVAVDQNYIYLANQHGGLSILSAEGLAVEEDTDSVTASTTWLGQNYPNLFNSRTTINYNVAIQGPASLRIYNVTGQLVKALADRPHLPGKYSVVWDGTDGNGKIVANGTYFYQLKTSSISVTKQMVLLR